MKLWVKAIIFSSIGIVTGVVLPLGGGDTLKILGAFSEVIVSLGTWLLIPLVLCQTVTNTYELKQEKGGFSFVFRGLALVLVTAFAMSLLGGLGVVLFSPDRIPIMNEESLALDPPNFFTFVKTIFGENVLKNLAGPSSFLIAALALGIVLGYGMHKQKTGIKPTLDLFDSMSRILQTINTGIVNVLMFGLIFVASARVVMIRQIPAPGFFLQLLAVILILVTILLAGVFPFLMYTVAKVKRPYVWLKHFLGSGLVGFFSGSQFVSLGILIQNAKDEYALSRRSWQWFYPFASILGRAGTAMISTIAFILIVRSHAGTEISFLLFIGVVVTSAMVSFMMGSVPGAGVMVSISLLSAWFGQGERYLILQPVAPLLISLAAFLDVATQVFVTSFLSALPEKDGDVNVDHTDRFRDEFMLN